MSPPSASDRRGSWFREARELDQAVYRAVATTPTPRLNASMRRLSRAADHSKLSIGTSVLLAVAGGAQGRKAAVFGLSAVGATSAVVNLVVKPIGHRRRPDRTAPGVAEARQVPMPGSASFPSGHAAAAVAFASGAGRVIPFAGLPLHTLAALVGYSRVHTGVHYPGDVIGGAVLGAAIADVTGAWISRIWPTSRSSEPPSGPRLCWP